MRLLAASLYLLLAGCSEHRQNLVAPTAVNSLSSAPLSYPSARRENCVDNYNGVQVEDHYRWLEQLDSAETRTWVTAEARLTKSYLSQLTARETLKQRLSELMKFERFGIPFERAGRYFYTYNSGLQEQSLLCMVTNLSGTPVTVVDPNLLSTNGSLAVLGYVASHDGKLLTYGVSQGGSDWTDWRIRDLVAGHDLPDVLHWTKYYHPVFTPDGRGIYYSAFPEPPAGQELHVRDLGHAVYYHALGTPSSADRAVYKRPDHPDWQFEPHLSPDGRLLVLTVGEGEVGDKGLENVYVIDLGAAGSPVIPLIEGFDAEYIYAGSDSGLLFFQTTLEASNGRVIAIDPRNPDRSRWREVVPQGRDSLDIASGSVTLVNHELITVTLHDVHSKVTVYGLDGSLRSEVLLPGLGTARGFSGEPSDSETFYSYTDLATPPTIFRLNLATRTSSVFKAPRVSLDLKQFESRQVFYRSKDGTRIPMFLLSKKGLHRDGTNPTLLYGYGGFGISTLPRFDPARMVWLEQGGIFAIANIRGGGEYGDQWHRQAIRAQKQKVFDDFIAAAEWLVNEHYTKPSRLAIEGGSNGGLLVAACETQRPDLFGAVLAHVGVMDMLRFNQFGQGTGWEGDYGSPQNPQDFKALYAYSPYHNIHKGSKYPATLIFTGDHDSRVMPAHSFKFTAALQAAQAGRAPILLRVELSGGHGGGPTTSQRIGAMADAYAFLLQNLK
ncbi:MAG: S9 family peptidase [Verrucomicrobia bacterium]|nr:MAG: S9 family peptidase [Verrucomicrobiota bacterium]